MVSSLPSSHPYVAFLRITKLTGVGGLHSLSSYGTVMLIAGGIGITHPMSYMHEFMEGYSARTIAIRRVNLIWVVRSLGMS